MVVEIAQGYGVGSTNAGRVKISETHDKLSTGIQREEAGAHRQHKSCAMGLEQGTLVLWNIRVTNFEIILKDGTSMSARNLVLDTIFVQMQGSNLLIKIDACIDQVMLPASYAIGYDPKWQVRHCA